MKDTRERVFFWLGVFVLPIFWSWFTLGRSFTRTQRYVAFSWMILTVCLVISRWPAISEHWTLISIGYPIVVGWVTIALLGWLCFRTGLFSFTIVELVFMWIIFAPTFGRVFDPFYRAIGAPFEMSWLLPPTILALLHLVIGPLKRATRKIPFLFGYKEGE
jgi:hypothetical protein